MKDIKGFEGLYAITEDGRVYNYKTKKFLTGTKGDGYVTVELRKDGKSKWLLVHRLVAEAYLENPNNYPVVNHKDEVKNHNWVDNLEWCTQKDNVNHGTARQRLSAALTGKKQSEEHRRHNSEAKLGEKNPNYGKPRSEETKKKISEALRRKYGTEISSEL